jgi:hypothetical protein
MEDFYTTKIVVELELSTQMGPDSAFNILHTSFVPMPACRGMKVLSAESNFQLHAPPSKDFINVAVPAWVKKEI